MPFTETQLSTWSNQGSTTNSANTYNSIKTCIDGNNWNDDVYYSIYLQGSYKNSTNIRGDSDVDVVVEFTSIFYSNKHKLPAEQLKEFNEYFKDGKYSLESFKSSIIKRLKFYYGDENVIVGNKSIKVLGTSNRLDCDVICCAEYREYGSFSKTNPNKFSQGIVFWANDGEKVINFPKYHYDNGVEKNKKCSNNYKSSIRIIKNMEVRMVNINQISDSLAPSYFIECLLYNVQNIKYQHTNYYNTILSILNSLYEFSDEDLDKFVCQNYQRYLFGSSNQQWNKKDCKKFISELIDFWNKGTN